MRIASCDDQKSCRETVKDLVDQYKQADPERPISLSSFGSAKELLTCVDERGGFDLYLLDCIMPEMDGIELGTELRSRGDPGMLIYITVSPDFALDSYRVNALNYLLKPVDKTLFFNSLDKAFSYFSQSMHNTVSIKTADSVRLLPVADIRYAERAGKRICYHMADGGAISGITFNGSFIDEVSGLLAHDGMLAVGSSFVVNLAHVTEVTKTDMVLTGGLRVPIPRRVYDSVKKEWAAFWLNGGRYRAFLG